MSITTTENITDSKLICGRCGRQVLVCLVDANNVPFGLCCATGSAREELVRLHRGYTWGETAWGGDEPFDTPLDSLGRFHLNPSPPWRPQTLTKNPRPPHEVHEEAPLAAEDAPLYVGKNPRREGPPPGYVPSFGPAYGRGGEFLGGGRKSR